MSATNHRPTLPVRIACTHEEEWSKNIINIRKFLVIRSRSGSFIFNSLVYGYCGRCRWTVTKVSVHSTFTYNIFIITLLMMVGRKKKKSRNKTNHSLIKEKHERSVKYFHPPHLLHNPRRRHYTPAHHNDIINIFCGHFNFP